jgi:hypothetical protein
MFTSVKDFNDRNVSLMSMLLNNVLDDLRFPTLSVDFISFIFSYTRQPTTIFFLLL